MNRCLLAEYEADTQLLAAIASLRSGGYRVLDAYTPYPLQGIDEALERPPSRIPWLVFAVGIGAAVSAYALEWLLNAYLYPLNVGHRPPHYPLAFVPIGFEMGILFASFAAFIAVLVAGRLVRLHHPVFDAEGFASASNDAFWLSVCTETADLAELERALWASGARRVVSPTGAQP